MDPARFDRFTRRLATGRLSRRTALGGASFGIAALAVGRRAVFRVVILRVLGGGGGHARASVK